MQKFQLNIKCAHVPIMRPKINIFIETRVLVPAVSGVRNRSSEAIEILSIGVGSPH